ncbi:Uncharacterised protein [Prevotella intermedia]|nr:Uncharacterised protein [Prevotella intermedia]
MAKLRCFIVFDFRWADFCVLPYIIIANIDFFFERNSICRKNILLRFILQGQMTRKTKRAI